MSIPKYQEIMFPLLKIIADGDVHKFRNVINLLAAQFALSDEEREELLPSGGARLFDNRVGWANTYLKKSGLVKSERRGTLQITERGLKLLNENLDKIDDQFLKQFPEFIDFIQVRTDKKTEKEKVVLAASEEITSQTPEELLEYSYQSIKESLAHDIRQKLQNCTPDFFEKLVVDLITKMGYGGSKKDAGKAIGKSGDGGIDGIIKEDKLGLDIIYIQAKKWINQVPIKDIRDFAGALLAKKAKKGIFITTSNYSSNAYDFVKSIEPKIILIDGQQLAEYMIENNVGISTERIYEIKKIDFDYFEES